MPKPKPDQTGDRRSRERELTETEWLIMRAVWDNEPCAAPTVQEALQGSTGWTYSTVKTLMDRMAEKGILAAERVRNLVLYRSALTVSQAQKGEIKRTLKRAFDGALTPMMQFMLDSENISEQELEQLERQIKEHRQRRSRTKGRTRK